MSKDVVYIRHGHRQADSRTDKFRIFIYGTTKRGRWYVIKVKRTNVHRLIKTAYYKWTIDCHLTITLCMFALARLSLALAVCSLQHRQNADRVGFRRKNKTLLFLRYWIGVCNRKSRRENSYRMFFCFVSFPLSFRFGFDFIVCAFERLSRNTSYHHHQTPVWLHLRV